MQEDKNNTLKKHDKSELALFKAKIYEALGNTTEAVNVLETKDLVVNRTAKNEALARIYGSQGNKDKAVSH